MNNCVFTGRLVNEVKLMQTQGGTSVTRNAIAVRRDFKNANGEIESDFINIVVYGQTAEYLSNYAGKGVLIEVVGRWQHRSYMDNQGNTRYVDECVINSASVLQRPQEQPQQQVQEQPQDNQYSNNTSNVLDDDLPF